MASAYRQPTLGLDEELALNGAHYSFFELLQILLAEQGQKVEERALYPQKPEGVRFRVDPSLGFPRSDVLSVQGNSTQGYEVLVSFLGLHGSSSPLPDHFIEAGNWSAGEQNVQRDFNDFFSNRLIWLFFLIWRKYRYYVRFEAEANDQFSDWMFSLIGIGSKETRGTADVPWAKLLTYLGVLAARTRSPGLVAGVISHAFNLPSVTIREWEERWVDIPEDQRFQNGIMNTQLGSNMTIGSKVRDVAGKFTVVIRDLSFARFQDFLPDRQDNLRLRELVEFLLKDQLAYDIELHMIKEDVPQFKLGAEQVSDLGWTTFSGDPVKSGQKPVVLPGRN